MISSESIAEDIEALRTWFSYDPLTGTLTWTKSPCARVPAGKVVSTPHGEGYLRVMFRGKNLFVHRVAWALTHGDWPELVDHINGRRSDNRLVNLRNASHSENCVNKHVGRGTNSGHTNVYEDRRYGTFRATIYANRKRIYLGTFSTADAAGAAVSRAKLEHHGPLLPSDAATTAAPES